MTPIASLELRAGYEPPYQVGAQRDEEERAGGSKRGPQNRSTSIAAVAIRSPAAPRRRCRLDPRGPLGSLRDLRFLRRREVARRGSARDYFPTGPSRRDRRQSYARPCRKRAVGRTRPVPPAVLPSRCHLRGKCRTEVAVVRSIEPQCRRARRASEVVRRTHKLVGTAHRVAAAPSMAAASAREVHHGGNEVGPLGCERQRRPATGRDTHDKYARGIDERLVGHEVDGGADIVGRDQRRIESGPDRRSSPTDSTSSPPVEPCPRRCGSTTA